MNKTQIRNTLILTLTALIWGCSNVSEYVGAGYVGTFTFLSSRSWLAGIFLIPVVLFMKSRQSENRQPEAGHSEARSLTARHGLLIGGITCGIFLFLACSFQQAGIAYTTPAKAGFITSLYTLIVPIITIFMGRKVGKKIWLCVVLGLIGVYLLCMTSGFSLNRGDLLILICSFLFACHILIVNYFAPRMNGVKMSCIQFFTVAVISTVLMFIFETPTWTDIKGAAIPVLYSGIMSSGVGYTLQIVGQKDLNPTIASLAMSLESVFTALAGFIILNQNLTSREWIGCTLMFAAVIFAQLPNIRWTDFKQRHIHIK